MSIYLHPTPIQSLHLERNGIPGSELFIGNSQNSHHSGGSLSPLAVLQRYKESSLFWLNHQIREESMARVRGLRGTCNPSDKRASILGGSARMCERSAKCLMQEVWHLGSYLPECDQGDMGRRLAFGAHRSRVSPDRKRSVAIHTSSKVRQEGFIHASYGIWAVTQ